MRVCAITWQEIGCDNVDDRNLVSIYMIFGLGYCFERCTPQNLVECRRQTKHTITFLMVSVRPPDQSMPVVFEMILTGYRHYLTEDTTYINSLESLSTTSRAP